MCWWRITNFPFSKGNMDQPVMWEGNIYPWKQRCMDLAITTLMWVWTYFWASESGHYQFVTRWRASYLRRIFASQKRIPSTYTTNRVKYFHWSRHVRRHCLMNIFKINSNFCRWYFQYPSVKIKNASIDVHINSNLW